VAQNRLKTHLIVGIAGLEFRVLLQVLHDAVDDAQRTALVRKRYHLVGVPRVCPQDGHPEGMTNAGERLAKVFCEGMGGGLADAKSQPQLTETAITFNHHVDDRRARRNALGHLDVVLIVRFECDFSLCLLGVCHAAEKLTAQQAHLLTRHASASMHLRGHRRAPRRAPRPLTVLAPSVVGEEAPVLMSCRRDWPVLTIAQLADPLGP